MNEEIAMKKVDRNEEIVPIEEVTTFYTVAYTAFGALVVASWFVVKPRSFGIKVIKRMN